MGAGYLIAPHPVHGRLGRPAPHQQQGVAHRIEPERTAPEVALAAQRQGFAGPAGPGQAQRIAPKSQRISHKIQRGLLGQHQLGIVVAGPGVAQFQGGAQLGPAGHLQAAGKVPGG